MHKDFCEILVRELIIHLQEENVTASGISRGRRSPTASLLSRLEVKCSQHWPFKRKTTAVLRVFAAQENTEHTVFLLEV